MSPLKPLTKTVARWAVALLVVWLWAALNNVLEAAP